VPGPTVSGAGLPIAWLDHTGATTPLRAARAPWTNLRISPDGGSIAMQILGRHTDIWVYDLRRDTLTPLTPDEETDTNPLWTNDGSRIVFASARGTKPVMNIYMARVDGAGGVQRLTESPNVQVPASWHPSGKYLAFEESNPNTRADVMILPLTADAAQGWKAGTPISFVNGAADERHAAFSPDGNWLAYVSNQSGQEEVYVRSFPEPGGQWQVSTGGGTHPVWSKVRHELFYSSPTGVGTPNRQISVVRFTVEGRTFKADKARLWSERQFQGRGPNRMFDVHPDGTRFAVAPVEEGQDQRVLSHVTMVFNLFAELRRLAPAAR